MHANEGRRPVQFHLALPAEVADALTAAAVREDRTVKAQAARYVLAGLRRDGYLAADPADDRAPSLVFTRSAQ